MNKAVQGPYPCERAELSDVNNLAENYVIQVRPVNKHLVFSRVKYRAVFGLYFSLADADNVSNGKKNAYVGIEPALHRLLQAFLDRVIQFNVKFRRRHANLVAYC